MLFKTQSQWAFQALLCCCFCTQMFAQDKPTSTKDSWKLEKDQNGVKVYTRKVSGWDIKEFKAIFTAKTTMADVENMLRDSPGKSKWMQSTSNTKDVKKVSNNEIYTYSLIDAPWPVADRDNITKLTYKYVSDTELVIDMDAAPNIIPEVKEVVRISKMKGYWKVKDIGNGYIEVTQQCVAELDGTLPAWLVNTSIVDNPHGSMKNMKELLEGKQTVKLKGK